MVCNYVGSIGPFDASSGLSALLDRKNCRKQILPTVCSPRDGIQARSARILIPDTTISELLECLSKTKVSSWAMKTKITYYQIYWYKKDAIWSLVLRTFSMLNLISTWMFHVIDSYRNKDRVWVDFLKYSRLMPCP